MNSAAAPAKESIHTSTEEVFESIAMPRRHRDWMSLDSIFTGVLGLMLILFYKSEMFTSLSVLANTIILVIFLSGLMGIREIPFPNRIFGKQISNWQYPIMSGVLSMFMDSFLVLLLVVGAVLVGSEISKVRFRTFVTLGALIGGLGTYFGEVYQLPIALRYGMHYWHSMIPILPPIIIYLVVLGVLCSRLQIQVGRVTSLGEDHEDSVVQDFTHEPTWDDYAVLAGFIVALLVLHNPVLMLGLLCVFAYVMGEAENLINVIKTKTEVAVMLLLLIALIISGPVLPFLSQWPDWALLLGAVGNGVILGAVYPVSGDVWWDTTILSTGVQILPISSLVGIIVFKTRKDWWEFMKVSVPMTALWFGLCWFWFTYFWPILSPTFYEYFSTPSVR